MKYKVGDKVRIHSVRGSFNWASGMDQYLGKVMTVVKTNKFPEGYRMAEDNESWFWNEPFILGLAEIIIPSLRFPAIVINYNPIPVDARNPLVTYLEGC